MSLGHGYTRIFARDLTGSVAAMLAIAVGRAGSLAASDGKHRGYGVAYSQALDMIDMTGVLKRMYQTSRLQDAPVIVPGGIR